ncbi:MAG: YggT family protein [Alphaproteobacteria bacterium]
MNVIIIPLVNVLFILLDLYLKAIFLSVIISWLVAFNIINVHQRFVYLIRDFLYRITEPAFRQIRRIVPPISGIDLSPLFLILIIYFLQNVIAQAVSLL